MPVHDHRGPPVLLRPWEPHRQTEFVGLSGGLPVQGEGSHGSRRAPLHLLAHPRVGHHETTSVEDEMADEPVDERQHLIRERRRLDLQLLERLAEAVRDLDVRPLQGAR